MEKSFARWWKEVTIEKSKDSALETRRWQIKMDPEKEREENVWNDRQVAISWVMYSARHEYYDSHWHKTCSLIDVLLMSDAVFVSNVPRFWYQHDATNALLYTDGKNELLQFSSILWNNLIEEIIEY